MPGWNAGLGRIENKAGASSELKALAAALQRDLSPAAAAVQAFLQAPTQAEALRLLERLPQLLPDDPEMAAILEEALTEAFEAGQARLPDGQAEKPEAAPEETPEAENTAANSTCRAEHPETCRVHGLPAGRQAEAKTAAPTEKSAEDLPPEPDPKAAADEYRKANRARGEAALRTLLETHVDVPAAMVSRKLGPIDFIWGRVWGNHEGYGFAHIIDKHGLEAAQKVPEILAYGKYFEDKGRPGNYLVFYQGTVVALKRRADNLYVVSSYEAKEKAAYFASKGGHIENRLEDDARVF